MFDDLASLIDDLLQLAADEPSPDASALTLFLKCYRATERPDVRAALEPALGVALALPLRRLAASDRAAYLSAFVEALPVADDARVRSAIESLVESLRAEWGGLARTGDAALGVDACMRAAAALQTAAAVVPSAIDEMERIIAGAYRPGDGLADALGDARSRGSLDAHVRCASALVTAFELSARIQYAMLAEELMQFARRTLWDAGTSAFAAAPAGGAQPFGLNCAAAVVLCRLAALHQDGEYRAAAVVADGADYHADAGRILAALSARLPGAGFERADYGLALNEWLGGS